MTPTASTTMFARDFDDLRPGDSYTSGRRVLTGGDVKVFAALTGDHHPVHVDAGWAASSPFGGRIAHGMLILSAALGELPLDPERVIALRRLGDVVFKRPLAVGEGITVDCEIDGLRVIDAGTGIVSCIWRIKGDDGKLRARAGAEVLWRRAPDPVPASVEQTDEGLRVCI